MNLNATLLGQMITFAIFIWFTWRFVWPPVIKALEDRQKKIADGLSAAEQSVRALEAAELRVHEELKQAREAAAHILESANKRAESIIVEAHNRAREDEARIIALAKNEIAQEVVMTRRQLQAEMAGTVVQLTEKLLGTRLDQSANDQLVEKFIAEVGKKP